MKTLKKNLFHPQHCSPDKNNSFSCLDDKLIRKVARILNKLHKKNKNIQKISIRNRSIEDIYQDISDNIQRVTQCDSEACLLSVKDLMKHLGKDKTKFEESFKPLQPKEWEKDVSDNRWVSNEEIDDILFQDDDLSQDFYYYGAVPIDFSDCSVSNLCSFNLKRHLDDNHKKIAVVFNTDTSDGDGQHWISMYLDLIGANSNGTPGIYFFDSYGRKPCNEIHKLILKIKRQGRKHNVPFMYRYNKHPFQNSGYECGMYAIHFIKQMLQGNSFHQLLNSSLSDNSMVTLRDADKGGYLLSNDLMKGGKIGKTKKKKTKKKKTKT